MSTTATKFAGTVGGITYTDRDEFERTARALGFRDGGARADSWKLGTPVCVTLADGERVHGQVWAQSEMRGYMWVALDNGRYVAVHTGSGTAYKAPRSSERVGQVAA